MVSIGLNDDPSSTLTLFGRKVYLVFISTGFKTLATKWQSCYEICTHGTVK